MLYLRQLLQASTPLLKRAIIATQVINISGKSSKGVASNKQLELHNSNYKKSFRRQGNSTYNIYASIQRRGLNYEAYRQGRKTILEGLGRLGTNYYTAKSTITDIVTIAENIVSRGFTIKQTAARAGPIGLSEDIIIRSIQRLVPKLNTLNIANLQRARNITNSSNNINVASINYIDRADATLRADIDQSIIFGVPNIDIDNQAFSNIDYYNDDTLELIIDAGTGRDS